MSNYLTTDGLKKIFFTSGGPPEACGICHMLNPALLVSLHLHPESDHCSFLLVFALFFVHFSRGSADPICPYVRTPTFDGV